MLFYNTDAVYDYQKYMKIKKLLRTLGIFILVLAWFLSGWPVIWKNPRIPPNINQALAATITYVGGQVSSSAGVSGNGTVTFSLTGGSNSTPQAGDLVVISFSNADTGNKTLTITNASAVAYTYAGGADLYQNGSSYDSNFVVGYRFMPATPETSALLAGGDTSGGRAWSVHVFRGVDANTPLDVAAVTAGGISSHLANPDAITPTTSGAWIYVAGAGATGTGANFAAAYLTAFLTANGVDTQDGTVGAGYVTWSSGAYDPAAFTGGGTGTTADSWNAITLALRPAASMPTVTTQATSSIKDTTATANGNITATGGENNDKEGFVYDTASKSLPGNVAPTSSGYASYTENTGSFGTGAFTVSLTGLSGGVTYYGRSYAHNSAGYSYGDEVSFTTAVISISITSDGTVSYGIIVAGASKNTTAGGLNDTQTAQNGSTIAENFNIKTSNATGGTQWTLGATPGIDIFVHEFSTNGGTGWTTFTTADSYQSLATGVAASGTQNFDLKITVPSSTTDYQQKTITVTVQAVAQ